MTALLAWFTVVIAAPWITAPVVRYGLGALLCLMPAMGAESTATTTNLIWTFAAVTPWALVATHEHRWSVTVSGVVVFLAATSTAVSVLFLPLAVWSARRSRRHLLVAGAFVVGLALQTAVVIVATQTERYHLLLPSVGSWSEVPPLLALRVFALWLVGDKAISALWLEHGAALMVASTGVIVAVIAVLMRGADRPHRQMAAVFFALAILVYAVPVGGRGAFVLTRILEQRYNPAHMHYSVAPVFLLASAVALLLDDGRRAARIGRVLFVLHVAVLTVTDFRVTTSRSAGPRWRDALAAAQRRCASAPPDRAVVIPTDRYNTFRIEMTCGDLESRRSASSPSGTPSSRSSTARTSPPVAWQDVPRNESDCRGNFAGRV